MRSLIKGGAIISMDPKIGELRRGDILVDGELIADVAPELSVTDAEVIDASDMIVLPGLVDGHRHLWQTGTRADSFDHTFWDLVAAQWPMVARYYSAEDVYACVLAGAADALDRGVTSLVDFCHIANTPEHVEENLRALRETGVRSLFLYGASMTRKLDEFEGKVDNEDSWAHARELYDREFRGTDGLINYGLAIQGPDVTTIEITADDIAVAREMGVPIGIHIGAPQGPPPKLSIKRMHEAGLLGPDIQCSHCCDSTDEELRLLAETGGRAVACPTIDIAFGMGQPATARLREAGLRPALGVDSVIGASGDMFEEMRSGLLYERSRRANDIYSAGRDVKSADEMGFTTREALEAATIGSAHAMWLDEKVGSLTPGKKADIVLLRATDLNLVPASDLIATVVGCAHGGNVDTVIVNGKVVKRNGKLVDLDLDRVRRLFTESRDRLFAAENYPGLRPPAMAN